MNDSTAPLTADERMAVALYEAGYISAVDAARVFEATRR